MSVSFLSSLEKSIAEETKPAISHGEFPPYSSRISSSSSCCRCAVVEKLMQRSFDAAVLINDAVVPFRKSRPLPTLPDLEISEQTVGVVADELHLWINHTLAIAHDIAIGRDLKSFLKVAVGLWLVSYIGTLFKFLTLVYIGVILSLSVPVVYDKYQHFIDEKLHATHRIIQKQYMKIDESGIQWLGVTGVARDSVFGRCSSYRSLGVEPTLIIYTPGKM
ncbi:Reticulon-like protein B10 [Hibiscus syriacus]|uniref:Reticulon-like protein n=1 Tax=Hibiscus syriacus TaxID=106335 RepID=A0A6A3BKY5_HIBSY|nr:Reticulon-like protein B10 [Hibiscus syriacus]